MYAIVLYRPEAYEIEAVMVIDGRRPDAIDRAVALAADLEFFDREDEAREAEVTHELERLGDLVHGPRRITVVRAVRG
jgi:citrate lyase beta subunit